MTVNHLPQQNHPQPSSQPMPAPALPLAVWGTTDKGREREGNEDAVYPHSGSETFPFKPGPQHLAQKGQLLVVADGVGGAQAGHEASHWAIRVAVERYYDLPGPDLGADLQSVIEVANSSLHQYLQNMGTREAGSTMAAAVIRENTLHVANVGDSRIYLLRNGQIAQLTRDHTLTQHKIDQGLIRPEQAEMDADRSVLTRSLGAGPTVQVDLFPPLQLAPGDIVLLCSDGLTDMLSDEEIARLLNGGSPKRSSRRLTAAANKRGGFDNISVVVARVGGRQPPAGGGVLGGLLDDVRRMPRQQKIILLVGAMLVAAALCAMVALGWATYDRRNGTSSPTAAPTDTMEVVPVATTTPAAVPPMEQPTEEVVVPGQPTSTLVPTPALTPTDTPRPPAPMPTSTPTPTPTPETPMPTPEGGGGGGEQSPTEEPTPEPTPEG